MDDCRSIVMSEEYADFIVNYSGSGTDALKIFGGDCYQRISSYYGIVYKRLSEITDLSIRNTSFSSIPALYGLMERDIAVRVASLEEALEKAGILRLQNQPILKLKGQGCIMAYIDTGIDITDDEFRFSNGDTRILRLWDMTDNTGTPPTGIYYGSEYSDIDINRILKEGGAVGNDEENHGNILAKIGSGKSGAVSEAYMVVVKLKPAKKYLRDYYFVKDNVVAYQENDIMLAVNYIKGVSLMLSLPVSLSIALGTNGRSHDGRSALSYILDRFVSSVGAVATLTTGDEGNKQLHSLGMINTINEPEDIQFRVDERQKGLVINLWGVNPQIFSVGLVSPTGEVIERVIPRIGKSEIYKLIFDGTTVVIEYDLVEGESGDELIIIRLENPTAGVWTLRVYGENLLSGKFNLYLPISQFIYENTYFLEPEPDITIIDPAYGEQIITTSTLNPISGALYLVNGRGFARDGEIKPDLAVGVSCAVAAGAACQFLNWAITEENDVSIRASDIKSYLIRGANRREDISYPSTEWGYGSLDIYNSFQKLRGN